MKERGFIPFSAAGAIIVVVIAAMVASVALSTHQRSKNIAADTSVSSLATMAAEVHGNLQLILKQSVYQALWEVGKEASRYHENGLAEIELRATKYFSTLVSALDYRKHDARISLDLHEEERWPPIKISAAENDLVLAQASLPEGSRIKLSSWDGSVSLAIPFENVKVLVNSRYFLLSRKMDEFIEKRGNIVLTWTTLEYSRALSSLILTGRVELNRARTRATFEAAWALHELSVFGSSDYLAVGGDKIGSNWWEKARVISENSINREKIYELLPPPPLKNFPGISVYHEFKVKDVIYRRQDPAGLLGLPMATPIPIGSSGATIWWGQWEIIIETEENPIEEIFDFDNPTIPRLHDGFFVHLPLAYRWELSEKRYSTIISLVSPKPFAMFVC
ncbi:MAG: hypothetical protein APZ16_04845 [Candidatus Hadarchaeum yellowstonense]|uniref:Uncharacterized protein n=1 Tax=Hadarchaeum yellowstonense TaxID=1776334 RepID=A0A147K1H8_HADYE|nr:MAG: hypothetical protein APZ16_04845 [Candidatus Hadarchaeum yellowstonense]